MNEPIPFPSGTSLLSLLGVLALTWPGATERRTSPSSAPEHLAETGLYADFATGALAADVWPFEPQYPLWSDGATKRRWIRLPGGAAVDASDPNDWRFPVGTRIWKEFSFERPIETRYLEKLPDGSWLRVSYLWNEAGTEARLAPAGGLRGVTESLPGVPYDVPSRSDCGTCHAAGDGVLGFTALQLSADRDPLAPHAGGPAPEGQDLAAFVARGLVRGLPAEHLSVPPRIDARTPRERAVLGYLGTHCGTCHRDDGLLKGLGLVLDSRLRSDSGSEEAGCGRVLATVVDCASRFRPAGAPDTCRIRVRPGAPHESSLYHRMSTRQPTAQMPPLGTRVVDREALALIEAWILEDLQPSSAVPSN